MGTSMGTPAAVELTVTHGEVRMAPDMIGVVEAQGRPLSPCKILRFSHNGLLASSRFSPTGDNETPRSELHSTAGIGSIATIPGAEARRSKSVLLSRFRRPAASPRDARQSKSRSTRSTGANQNQSLKAWGKANQSKVST